MSESMRVFRNLDAGDFWPGYSDAYAADWTIDNVDFYLVDGLQRSKGIGAKASEGWERASSAIKFQVGERPTLEAAIWPALTAYSGSDIDTLKAEVDAAAVGAGFTLGSP